MPDFPSELGGSTFFSEIDLRKAYYKIPENRADIAKRGGTIAPFVLYEFLRVPLEPCKVSNSFQQMMDRVLSGLNFCFWYLDYNILASHIPGSSSAMIGAVHRLQKHVLVINREKCVLYCLVLFETILYFTVFYCSAHYSYFNK
jgi:hypothetical protein